MPTHTRIEHVLDASHHIDPVFLDSPTLTNVAFDAALHCQLVAKDETANPIGSFKGRGTELFAALALPPGEPVVCASAGNFGQGLARAAIRRGHTCTVFAAETANPVKLDAMRRLGAEVRLAGIDFDAAKDAARHHAAAGLRFVEDGSEAELAEGAGTLALELAASTSFDAIVVQLGNGALLAGVGTAIRHVAPHAEIIAVVAAGAPAMKLSIDAGHVVETARTDTIADGIAVRVPIAATLTHLRTCCDDVVAVSEARIFEAMRLIHHHLGIAVEPSGAVGVAAILDDPERFAGRRVATILCGGNLSPAMRERLLAA
ncbi:pyridoxal-phosphate dependent enzyme [Rhodanobacter sp. FDAARGOS 1247]|uniref:threonine ammonia-lyase n=1 Tax=Rhodanobacter sp. FDAARGOS 1247 TaxID=2778082 RepID=UPI00194EA991|nr:pyridoxal-phosphate dependent enzyme [Rhodanobacter sp. FDAARGOS 1247]QRP62342.1 pyridoxal-phosphate dependent enzyme [Rhodanobacter sp. FDAARGOS 1247]